MANGKTQTRKKRRGLEDILQASENSLRRELRNYRALEKHCGNVRGILVEFLTDGEEPHLMQQPIPSLDLGGYHPIPSVSYVPDLTRRVADLEVMFNRANQYLTGDQSLTPEQAQNLSYLYGQPRVQTGVVAPAAQTSAQVVRLTQEQKNVKETNRILSEYVGKLQKRRDEDLAAFDSEKESVLKMHPDDPKWKAWAEDFYTKKREERTQEYGMWIRGVENFVDYLLKIN